MLGGAAAGAAAGLGNRFNNADVDDVETAQWGKARDDFAIYRKVIRREMLWDWWPQEVSEKLCAHSRRNQRPTG